MKRTMRVATGLLLGWLFVALTGCTGARFIAPEAIETDAAVKVYTLDRQTVDGIVIKRDIDTITLVAESDHMPREILLDSIRRVERLDKVYDYDANLISGAEIEKYKENRNTWGYAIGGSVIGALGGLAVGYPVWLAADDPPPLFVAGVGAVIGSIYWGRKGIQKDREIAISQVRYLRIREAQLKAEQEELNELERKKQELLRQIEEKRNKEDDDN